MHIRKKLFTLIKWLANKVLPLFFWVFLIFGFDKPYISILTILSALIHELGHIAPLLLSHAFSLPAPSLRGFLLSPTKILSYKEKIVCAIGGPVSNIILFFALLFFGATSNEYLLVFALINLATGLSNLIPIEGYDGYSILYEIFSFNNQEFALVALKRCSFVIISFLTLLSLCLIDRCGSGYWFFALFFISCLEKIKRDV